jgi:hypothetical protein
VSFSSQVSMPVCLSALVIHFDAVKWYEIGFDLRTA